MCMSPRLKIFLDLGMMPLANSFLTKEMLGMPEPKFPLRVFFCEDCNLSQLIDVVPSDVLFRNYIYFSSSVPHVPDHFKKYAEEVAEKFIVSTDDLVVEIGSNDGVLLGVIKEKGVRVLGVDPAQNIAAVANARGVETLPEFFSEALAHEILKKHGHAKVIIGNNVVAHIDDHHDLVKGVKALLREEGVFIFEAPYLLDMFENLTFDTVYHEHLSYLSVMPLMNLFRHYGMEIFDIKLSQVQGNSIRVYTGKEGKHPLSSNVAFFVRKERSRGAHEYSTYLRLADTVYRLKEEVGGFLKKLKSEGKRIAAYGAPAKGNTLLNFFGIGNNLIEYATEELPPKIGLFTPGTHIPVVDITWARKNPPDYFLLLAWNYKDAILKKEEELRSQGVKFIMPVGDVRVI